MSATTYDEVLTHIQHLTTDEQLRLLQDLAELLRRQVSARKLHSILELQGLGKDIWGGIDAQEYVNQERASY